MLFKYKNSVSTLLFIFLTLAFVSIPTTSYARLEERDAPATSTTTTKADPANCSASGTCADCSAPSSSSSGCIDCSAVASNCKDGATTVKNCDKDSCDFVSKVLSPLVVLLSGLVGLAVALSIIVGSIQYSASAGDPQKAAKGRDRIKNAIIALIAYIFLFAFLNFIIPGGLI